MPREIKVFYVDENTDIEKEIGPALREILAAPKVRCPRCGVPWLGAEELTDYCLHCGQCPTCGDSLPPTYDETGRYIMRREMSSWAVGYRRVAQKYNPIWVCRNCHPDARYSPEEYVATPDSVRQAWGANNALLGEDSALSDAEIAEIMARENAMMAVGE